MSDLVSVQYVGKNMAPLGGVMMLTGETRYNVPRYQVREALRHNPGKFVILGEEVANPAENAVPAVRGHSHDHVEVTTSAEPGEYIAVAAEPAASDEPVTVLSEDEHVDQPEQPGKSPAKRRTRKK